MDQKESLDAGEILGPRAARAVMVQRGRRETLVLRGHEAWLEKSAVKEPRETEVCLDPEAPRELLGSQESRDLGETLGMLGLEEIQDSQAPREILEGLDSATQDPEGHPVKKASPAHQALREAEETLV